jgi:hypothetical protein
VLRFRIIKLAPGVPDAPDMRSPAAAARPTETETAPDAPVEQVEVALGEPA